MQLRAIAFTAALALPLVHAVDLNLFWSMFEDGSCNHRDQYATCTDIAMDKCCVYTSPFWTVEGTGLDTTGIPAVVSERAIPS
jgi:hypothetical protein